MISKDKILEGREKTKQLISEQRKREEELRIIKEKQHEHDLCLRVKDMIISEKLDKHIEEYFISYPFSSVLHLNQEFLSFEPDSNTRATQDIIHYITENGLYAIPIKIPHYIRYKDNIMFYRYEILISLKKLNDLEINSMTTPVPIPVGSSAL